MQKNKLFVLKIITKKRLCITAKAAQKCITINVNNLFYFLPLTPEGEPTRIIAQRKPKSSLHLSCCKNLLVPGTIQ